MESIREIVRENLIRLRKEHKLTQLELSQKIAYSDKAISRWETGDVLPDIETLATMATLYGVPIAVFFEKYDPSAPKKPHKVKKEKPKKEKKEKLPKVQKEKVAPHLGKKPAAMLLSVFGIWSLSLVLFFFLGWMTFIWAIPATALCGIVMNLVWGNRWWSILTHSLFSWSFATALFLQWFEIHLYLLFILCIPLQILFVLLPFILPSRKSPPTKVTDTQQSC